MIDRDGNELDTALFEFDVNLDNLETEHIAKLTIKLADPSIMIYRDYYDYQGYFAGTTSDISYESNFVYYEDEDELILNVFNGFDVAIFNICALLGMGKFTRDYSVPYDEENFVEIDDSVQTITFTLEEFKKLHGFMAWFRFNNPFIEFKGLSIGSNYLHDSCHNGAIPDYWSDNMKRGEKFIF